MGARFYNSVMRRLGGVESLEYYDFIIDYAFEGSQSFMAANKALDDAAQSFRKGDKTAQDCVALLQMLNALPWDMQKAFGEDPDNADLKEYLPQTPDELAELENRLLAETKERGARILERLPDMSEPLKRVGELMEEIQETANRLTQMDRATYKEAAAQIREELNDQRSKLDTEADAILSQIKAAVFAESSVSEEEAMEWAKSEAVQVSDATLKFMASPKVAVETLFGRTYVDGVPGPDKETILKEIATIYRLTNGNLKTLKVTSKKVEGRSYFDHSANTVYWLDTNIDTLYHEAGHSLDYQNKTFVTAAKRFIQDRATGKPASLAKMTQNSAYGREEMAFPDTFIHPYVGKIYPNSSEVTSIGLQAFANIKYMRDLMEKDPEHLKLILGTLTAQGNEHIGLGDVAKVKMPNVAMVTDFDKTAAWQKALDDAIEAVGLKNKMMSPKGYRGFVLLKDYYEEGEYIIRRSRGKKTLIDFKVPEQQMAMRYWYLFIAQESALLPDMDLTGRRRYWRAEAERIQIVAPAWFTPITQLPRI